MKKFFAIGMVALIGIGSAQACLKKSEVSSLPADEDLVVFVMDTMQRLLPDAEIKIGKTVLRTSWDGRVILTPEQWNTAPKMTVQCNGFEALTIKNSAFSNPLIISMKPKKIENKKQKEESAMAGGGRLLFRSKSTDAAEATMPLMVTSAAVMEYDAADVIMPMMKGGAANNAAAGMLTAGEVNDFAKWHLWNNYLQSASNYQETWRLTPAHRYTVQVMNQHGYPIAARAVSLTDKNGNTLFQAVTDNTGKAELWAELTGEGLQVTGYRIQVDEQQVEAKEWSEGMNTFMLDEECEDRDGVDVMFVFDATGSMGDELRYLQAEMKDVIARASEATGGLDIRTGAVVYRDHSDEYVTRISRLTSDIATTHRRHLAVVTTPKPYPKHSWQR